MKKTQFSWEFCTKHMSFYVSGKSIEEGIANFKKEWADVEGRCPILKIQRTDLSPLMKYGEAINKKYFKNLKRKTA